MSYTQSIREISVEEAKRIWTVRRRKTSEPIQGVDDLLAALDSLPGFARLRQINESSGNTEIVTWTFDGQQVGRIRSFKPAPPRQNTGPRAR